ncbi:DUF3300 domain-containing protein [Falsihalocynthiibacter sp. SS001]|uniref:DUF3300 domain-containing protein n=1 Tax=Falsihalocynthiibacter sp. SS001 TaxID=3349698 RepID=UPI0036D2121A
MIFKTTKAILLCSAFLIPTVLYAQSDTSDATETADETLLTTDELKELVGPVALYPDTLLIQVLVAATYPMEVVKADQFVQDNQDLEREELSTEIDAQNWDDSVSVLATAFPDVLSQMADNADWMQTVGDAMLLQSNDVMTAVQELREVANENGALESGDEQTVEVTQDDSGQETIVIQPTDPEIVYVPQYDPQVVYSNDGFSSLATGGLLAFSTFVLLDEIFDDDDPWNDYWGCRHCGGWNGNPIIRDPDIDIDIGGDVNIGKRLQDKGWKPDEKRIENARENLNKKRVENGKKKLPNKKNVSRGDDLRKNLSDRTGAADIARDSAARQKVQNARASGKISVANKKAAIARTGDGTKRAAAAKKVGNAKGNIKKPTNIKRPANVSRPANIKKPTVRPSVSRGTAMRPHAAPRVRSGAARGRMSAGRRR